MADYKEKLNEVKDSVRDAAANIASEENKQKLADATGTVAEKAKGLKGKPKTILIIAVVLVAVIVLIGKAAKGGSSSNAEKEVKNYLQSVGYRVSDVKTEFKEKYKAHDMDNDKWIDAEFFLVSATLKGSEDQGVQYVLVSCERLENDFGDMEIEHLSDSKAALKNVTRSQIEDAKQLFKDARDTGELR